MLTFAPMLFFAVFIADVDGASYQYPPKLKEFNTKVQSSSASRSQEATRRLKIFESITKSEDQRNDDSSVSIEYEQGLSASDDDQTVDKILQDSLVELTEILRTLETNDPSKAMRIPVHLIPVQSSLMVFQSLLMMLSNAKESRSPAPWQQYLIESISNQQCSVLDLCKEFQQNFKCDGQGHLEIIILNARGSFDHLNLLMIPNTVTKLFLGRTKLKTISEWINLKGKSLKVLRVDGNFDLKVNLDGLTGELNHLPLEQLSISTLSIRNYFGEFDWQRALPKIGNWMRASTLTTLRIRGRVKRSTGWGFDSHSDGSCTFHE